MDRVIVRAFDRHVGDVALDLVAGVRQLDEEGRILLVPRRVRVGLGHDQRHVGDAGRGGKPLLAVEDIVLVAVLHGRGLHAGGIGAGSFLGHREADPLVAIEQRFEELFLLIFRAVGEDRHHRGIVRPLRVHRQRAEHALAELHLHQRIRQRAEAHAAIFLRHPRAPQAARAGLGPQRAEHFGERLGVEFLFRGDALIMDPLADFFADRLGFGRDFEIDRHGCFLASCCWSGLRNGLNLRSASGNGKQSLKRKERPCPISPIYFPDTPPNGSTPRRAASSPASAARGRRCCCCMDSRRRM